MKETKTYEKIEPQCYIISAKNQSTQLLYNLFTAAVFRLTALPLLLRRRISIGLGVRLEQAVEGVGGSLQIDGNCRRGAVLHGGESGDELRRSRQRDRFCRQHTRRYLHLRRRLGFVDFSF